VKTRARPAEHSSIRVLLDSNIWRYFVDAGAVGRLVSAVQRSGRKLCVAPACLYEATDCGTPDLRKAILSAMTLPSWHRLMPEAFCEAEEIKSEIERCRPEWLRAKPNLKEWQALRHDWMRRYGGAWDRATNDPQLIQSVQGPTLELARAEARDLKEETSAWSSKWRTLPLMSFLATDAPSEEPVEAWRHQGFRVFTKALSRAGHPYVEWLEGEVDLKLMLLDQASLRRFWLKDCQVENMPRQWLRWAFAFLQRMHKISDGTPVDSQLGTYLLDVDLFITADRILVGIAERCRAEAPFRIASARKTPGGDPGVEAALQEIRRPTGLHQLDA
jgi:hypothetical protein